jgi:hypothetical protein
MPTPALVLTLAVIALGAKFFAFIAAYAVNVFYFDQWDVLSPFFRGDTGMGSLFTAQFAAHRLGLGLVSVKSLYGATHWSTRAESFFIGGCIFAAMLLALILKRCLFGRFAYSDAAIPLIFLSLMQYETFIGASNPAFGAIPLLLVMLYCLALLVPNALLRYGLLLLLDFLLIYTGYGFFMGLITPVVFGLDGYRRLRKTGEVSLAQSLAGLALAAAALGSFFVHYSWTPNVDCFDPAHSRLADYPWFVALMLSAFLGPRRPVVLVTAGGLIGLAVVAAVMGIVSWRVLFAGKRSASERSIDLVTAVLLGYGLVYAVSAAVGRVCLGLPDAAQAPRYSTLLIPAFLALYFFLLSLPAGMPARIALVSFLLVILPGGVFMADFAGHKLADGKRAWAACYLRTGDIAQCDRETGFPVYPHPELNGMREKLEYLRRNHLSFFYAMK